MWVQIMGGKSLLSYGENEWGVSVRRGHVAAPFWVHQLFLFTPGVLPAAMPSYSIYQCGLRDPKLLSCPVYIHKCYQGTTHRPFTPLSQGSFFRPLLAPGLFSCRLPSGKNYFDMLEPEKHIEWKSYKCRLLSYSLAYQMLFTTPFISTWRVW